MSDGSKIAVACVGDKIGANRFTCLYFFIVGIFELNIRLHVAICCHIVAALTGTVRRVVHAFKLAQVFRHCSCCHMLSHCSCPDRNCPTGGAYFQISTGFQTLLLSLDSRKNGVRFCMLLMEFCGSIEDLM